MILMIDNDTCESKLYLLYLHGTDTLINNVSTSGSDTMNTIIMILMPGIIIVLLVIMKMTLQLYMIVALISQIIIALLVIAPR